MEYRCLSVRQPFAWAIVANVKTIENRVWNSDYRGTIALHASTSKTNVNAFRKDSGLAAFGPDYFPYGAIIGLVDMVDVSVYGPQHETDPFAFGPYCWKIANGRFLKEPIPLKGKLNLFKLDPTTADRIANAGTYQLDLASDVTAREIAEVMTPTLDPFEPYLNLIESFWGTGKNVDAIATACERLIAVAPEDAEGYAFSALLNCDSKPVSEVETGLRKALEIAPDYAFALLAMAQLHSYRGDASDGLPFANRLIELEPDNFHALTTRAAIHVRIGNLDQALADVEAAIRIDATEPIAYEIRAEAQAACGDTQAAIETTRAALVAYPADQPLIDLLARLEAQS